MNTLNTIPANYAEEILTGLLAQGKTANLEILGGGQIGVTQTLGDGFSALYTPDTGLVGLYKTEDNWQEPLFEEGYFEFAFDEEDNPSPSFAIQLPNALAWVEKTIATVKGGN